MEPLVYENSKKPEIRSSPNSDLTVIDRREEHCKPTSEKSTVNQPSGLLRQVTKEDADGHRKETGFESGGGTRCGSHGIALRGGHVRQGSLHGFSSGRLLNCPFRRFTDACTHGCLCRFKV